MHWHCPPPPPPLPAAGVAGNSLLLPRLKQLPERLLEVQATRQKLLVQVGPTASSGICSPALKASHALHTCCCWCRTHSAAATCQALFSTPHMPPGATCHLPQHTELEARINELVEGSVEDVLMLARWVGDVRVGPA